MKKRIVHSIPAPRLMETIGATNQKPAEAIGELIANSFDARYGKDKMNILIDMRDSKIAVLDDGKGMTFEVLEKAVCIGEDMSKYIERGEGAKGHFGMGFKTSCSTLGGYYEIYTRPANGKYEYHVCFDIGDYSKRPSGKDAWDVEIDEYVPDSSSPLKNMKHGTAFVISKLKDKSIVTSSVLAYVGEAFKGHIKTGDKITLKDDTGAVHEATPKNYDFVQGTKIEINEVFGPRNKYKITGWMALDSQTHNDGLYGFNIYRHNQLVEKWDKSWFRSHLMTSRVIGEVNMDFLDATFYKQGVQQSEDWQIVTAHMRDFLKPLVSASQDISKKGNINKPSEVKRIVKVLKKNYNVVIDDYDDSTSNTQQHVKQNEQTINDTIKAVVKEQTLVLEDGTEIEISYLEKDGSGNVTAPFDYIFSEENDLDDTSAELQVILYKDHPLWQKKVDMEVAKILATSDAVYRVLVEKLNFDTSDSLKIRNEWVQKRTDDSKE